MLANIAENRYFLASTMNEIHSSINRAIQ